MMSEQEFLQIIRYAKNHARKKGFHEDADDFGQEMAVYCFRHDYDFERARINLKYRWIDYLRKYRVNFSSLKMGAKSEDEFYQRVNRYKTMPLEDNTISMEAIAQRFSQIDSMHMKKIFKRLTKAERYMFSLIMLGYEKQEISKMGGITDTCLWRDYNIMLEVIAKYEKYFGLEPPKKRGRPKK